MNISNMQEQHDNNSTKMSNDSLRKTPYVLLELIGTHYSLGGRRTCVFRPVFRGFKKECKRIKDSSEGEFRIISLERAYQEFDDIDKLPYLIAQYPNDTIRQAGVVL